jgi:hypothetical protein
LCCTCYHSHFLSFYF